MTLEEAIKHALDIADKQEQLAAICVADKARDDCLKCAVEHRQLAEWLKILKSAKFEYDEAWRIITHPTPDVNYADKQRAQVILDTFRGSLGKMDERRSDD